MSYLASASVPTPPTTSWVMFLLGVVIGMAIAIKLR